MAGKVFLVGAGPGDPGLITLKGQRCLLAADVVVYDYLANPRLLDDTRPEAERILAGKHGGGPRVEQEVINALLVDRARRGLVVVRLKGGDPFIFGRGGEEAEAMQAAGIDFEIVPGVSSAIAVPAYAGIPLTHRDLASRVVFTAGYAEAGTPSDLAPGGEIAGPRTTLVLLMTQRQLASNMNRLIAAGVPAATPAAVVEWGTWADQQTVMGTVGDLAERAAAAGLQPPALAVVGDVVRLRARLNWFESKPLFGRRIVVTRPRRQLGPFADALEAAGAEVVPFPTIETVPPDSYERLDDALRRPAQFDWVVFTSVNGVHAFVARLRTLGGDIRAWHRARIAAIGPPTAQALSELGLQVALVPDEYRAEAVVAALHEAGVGGARVLLPRAAQARDVLPRELERLGASVEDIAAYRTVRPAAATTEAARSLFARRRVDLITFTSSSTVHNFVAAVGTDCAALLAETAVGCIGPITADTARSYGLAVAVQPAAYTIPAFADAIVAHFRTAPRRPRQTATGG
ncbi:uroporphyrinogen-III C-methyltransferase [Candidatus Binatia bacterium]|nr:uroporphyrinogen-III C-methyltransferase [Candidatus Binatia bacterium]